MTEKFNPSSEYYQIPNQAQEVVKQPSRLKRVGNKIASLILEAGAYSPYGIMGMQAMRDLDSKDIPEDDDESNIVRGEN
jgi:hypothetical protein